MIPSTYYSSRHNETFSVIVEDVQPHWACARFAKVRVQIGHHNFTGEHFVSRGLGDAMTLEAAYEIAVKDVERVEVERVEEDYLMLHGCD